jgi:hypothetical protein
MMSETFVQPPPSYRRIYVSWHEQWTLQRYVDNYLQERQLAVNDRLRAAVNRRIDKFPGKGALKKSDMDYYLDANASEFTEARVPSIALR